MPCGILVVLLQSMSYEVLYSPVLSENKPPRTPRAAIIFDPSQPATAHRQPVLPPISMLTSALHERLSAIPPPVSPVLLQEKMLNAERKRKERLDKLVMREKAKVKRAT